MTNRDHPHYVVQYSDDEVKWNDVVGRMFPYFTENSGLDALNIFRTYGDKKTKYRLILKEKNQETVIAQ